jgi:uncharacterized surface protein with fasciclin (FAS1) repeats
MTMVNPIQSLKFAAVAGVCSLGVVATDVALASDATGSAVAEMSQSTLLAQAGTIVDVAAGNDQFSTLVTAVQAADLVETLSGEGPFTVFAPTNAAFAALPPEALSALLEPANQDLLTEVLTYHVVAGELGADSVVTASTIETLNGPVDVNVVDGIVMINQADVILADVEASNGVIHAIDAVLIPDGVVSTLESRMAASEMTPSPEPATTTAPATTAEPVRGLW